MVGINPLTAVSGVNPVAGLESSVVMKMLFAKLNCEISVCFQWFAVTIRLAWLSAFLGFCGKRQKLMSYQSFPVWKIKFNKPLTFY
jgi:hypothetical protein